MCYRRKKGGTAYCRTRFRFSIARSRAYSALPFKVLPIAHRVASGCCSPSQRTPRLTKHSCLNAPLLKHATELRPQRHYPFPIPFHENVTAIIFRQLAPPSCTLDPPCIAATVVRVASTGYASVVYGHHGAVTYGCVCLQPEWRGEASLCSHCQRRARTLTMSLDYVTDPLFSSSASCT